MSILIKGIDLPKGDWYLDLVITADGVVRDYGDEDEQIAEAIELPDHGDLIERDALKDDMDDKRDCETWIGIEECLKCADAAPVVIPAERSVDKDKDVPCKGAERSEE